MTVGCRAVLCALCASARRSDLPCPGLVVCPLPFASDCMASLALSRLKPTQLQPTTECAEVPCTSMSVCAPQEPRTRSHNKYPGMKEAQRGAVSSLLPWQLEPFDLAARCGHVSDEALEDRGNSSNEQQHTVLNLGYLSQGMLFGASLRVAMTVHFFGSSSLLSPHNDKSGVGCGLRPHHPRTPSPTDQATQPSSQRRSQRWMQQAQTAVMKCTLIALARRLLQEGRKALKRAEG